MIKARGSWWGAAFATEAVVREMRSAGRFLFGRRFAPNGCYGATTQEAGDAQAG